MAVVLRTMRDFKRFLGRPGARIQVIRNTFVERQSAVAQEAYAAKGFYAPRTLQALTAKAAVFTLAGHPGTVWLYWDKGARGWKFDGDTVSVPLNAGLGPPDTIVYRCTYAPGFEPRERSAPPRSRESTAEMRQTELMLAG